jgi:hypothetical protein
MQLHYLSLGMELQNWLAYITSNCRPSAGQVCTGPAIFNQLDLFLPPCPITSRYNVIPAGYNGRVHADLSHNFPLTKPLHGCGAC